MADDDDAADGGDDDKGDGSIYNIPPIGNFFPPPLVTWDLYSTNLHCTLIGPLSN